MQVKLCFEVCFLSKKVHPEGHKNNQNV